MAWDFTLLAKPQVSLPHCMDMGRRHGMLTSMSFILYQVPLPSMSPWATEWTSGVSCMQRVCSWLRNIKSRNPHDVILGSKQFCLTFALKGDSVFSTLIGNFSNISMKIFSIFFSFFLPIILFRHVSIVSLVKYLAISNDCIIVYPMALLWYD